MATTTSIRPAAAEAPVVVRSRRVLDRRLRIEHAAIGVLWLVVLVRFWAWWLQPQHRGDPTLYVLITIALAYPTMVMPSIFWFFVGRMRRPVHREARPGLRVALVTPCVPSHEGVDVIRGQLQALPRVRYPHDSWVLDEGGDPRVRAIAEEHGVRYFTRHGHPEWNEAGPPFQARTKAGNVNAWLDHVAAEGLDYDMFVQLDVDHHPQPEYLDRTLGYFDDPEVAWVQAPSVYSNLGPWASRGLTEQDLVFQGPLQMGFYGKSRTPLIIGSHTVYRTAAVREIGGFQPTRAEDHLDTVLLAAAGYRGVFVPEVLARGDGPERYSVYLAQQFAWAYSMTQILLRYTPHLVRRFSPWQAFQFVMNESWYLLGSLTLGLLWSLPLVAVVVERPLARVALSQFFVYHGAVILTTLLMWWWTRPWHQPRGVLLSWRAAILEVARWPVVFWAVVNVLLGIRRPYMITPKGVGAARAVVGWRPYAAHFGLALLAIAVVATLHGHVPPEEHGYVGWALVSMVLMVAVLATAIVHELGDLRARTGELRAALRLCAAQVALLALVAAGAVAAAAGSWNVVVHSLR